MNIRDKIQEKIYFYSKEYEIYHKQITGAKRREKQIKASVLAHYLIENPNENIKVFHYNHLSYFDENNVRFDYWCTTENIKKHGGEKKPLSLIDFICLIENVHA